MRTFQTFLGFGALRGATIGGTRADPTGLADSLSPLKLCDTGWCASCPTCCKNELG